MLQSRTDLPLARDTSTRLLPWLIGVMVFLATVTSAGAMLLGAVALGWDAGLSNALTVQVPPLDDEPEAELEARVAAAVDVMRHTPGVAEVTVVPLPRLAQMLEPWLGGGVSAIDLPLPRLIDVRLEPDRSPDLAEARARLAKVVPEAELDSHELWRAQMLHLVQSLEMLALGAVALIGLAMMMVVVFAVRSGLAVHREVIEVLHLMGAQDSYIARQFQRHALAMALRGSLGGALLAAAVLAGLSHVAADVDAALLADAHVPAWQWALLLLVPLLASLIAMATTRHTVLRALRRLP